MFISCRGLVTYTPSFGATKRGGVRLAVFHYRYSGKQRRFRRLLAEATMDPERSPAPRPAGTGIEKSRPIRASCKR